MIATRQVETVSDASGWIQVGAVWVAWNTETGAVSVIYDDGEGGRLVVPGGEADSLPEAVALVSGALQGSA